MRLKLWGPAGLRAWSRVICALTLAASASCDRPQSPKTPRQADAAAPAPKPLRPARGGLVLIDDEPICLGNIDIRPTPNPGTWREGLIAGAVIEALKAEGIQSVIAGDVSRVANAPLGCRDSGMVLDVEINSENNRGSWVTLKASRGPIATTRTVEIPFSADQEQRFNSALLSLGVLIRGLVDDLDPESRGSAQGMDPAR